VTTSEPGGPGPSPILIPSRHDELVAVLVVARDRGFLGPGPIEAHIAHSMAFARAIARAPTRALDLGSGGGLPGLVLAAVWPTTSWTLLDAMVKRTAFLGEAIARLGWSDRVVTLTARAELAARGPLRGRCDLVVARSFARPAVTAECAAPFLCVGGRLVVSDPPEAGPAEAGRPESSRAEASRPESSQPEWGDWASRWPAEGLRRLGLRASARPSGPVSLQELTLIEPCPERFPRRVGVPAKRPLW
jgi:16S rRNA (guanine527-N7)-methyltransferase